VICVWGTVGNKTDIVHEWRRNKRTRAGRPVRTPRPKLGRKQSLHEV
jgi:hypothetical protein